MLSNGSPTALSAVLSAVGREDSAPEAHAARANPNMDAAEIVQLLASTIPAVAEAIGVGECTAITCSVCQAPKATVTPVSFISVDVAAPKQMTLHGALKYSCEPDYFGDESNPVFECSASCQKRQASTKRIHPCAPWPQRLLIVLRRYTFDFATMSTKKVMHRIAFPRNLELAAMCEMPLGSPPQPEYILLGAVVHTGSSTLSGTYSYETNPATLTALGLDDKQSVLDVLCPGGATPYILVYSRHSSSATSTSIAPSVASVSVQPATESGKPAPVLTDEQKEGSRRRRDCCCSLM